MTANAIVTALTVDDILARLQQQRTAMLDPLDIPGDWTPRQRQDYEARRRSLDGHIAELRQLPIFDVAPLHAKREQLVGLRTTLQTRLADSPDPDTIEDLHARNKEVMRQRLLSDSLKALQVGVKYWPNGAPMIPQPLADLLEHTCPACQHTTWTWPGTIPAVEDEIAAMEKKIAASNEKRERLMAGAMALIS